MLEEIITANQWLVITNPRAGKRQFLEQSGYVTSELKKRDIAFIFKKTEYSGHAIEIAKHYTRLGCVNFLVLGGDGTISEVINGIFSVPLSSRHHIKVALMPRGTGNDWARFWKIRKNNKESLNNLLQGKTQLIDIGQISFFANKTEKKHFFINSVGFGLDALTADTTNRLKKYVGSFSFLYTIALIIALIRHKNYQSTIEIDGKTHSLPLLSMNVANGPYTGGGIKQNPLALPFDGIFDMMMVGKISFKNIFQILSNLFNGKITQIPIIQSFKAYEVIIESAPQLLVEADGIMVPDAHSCRVNILPAVIQMVVPK